MTSSHTIRSVVVTGDELLTGG